jgi:hypothetical protein
MSNDGKAFTYVNQHASSDTDLSERHEWFDCACCPPNVTRTLAILGGYIWTFSANAETSSTTVNVHLYTAAALQFEVGNSVAKIVQTTDWPWKDSVTFSISIEGPPVAVEMRLRVPGWSPPAEVSLHFSKLQEQAEHLVTFECFLALSSVFRRENAQGIPLSPIHLACGAPRISDSLPDDDPDGLSASLYESACRRPRERPDYILC